MKNLRNTILILGFLLFFLIYGGSWVYRSLYREPRNKLRAEIGKYEEINEQMRQGIESMSKFVGENRSYYGRSFPRSETAVRTLYQSWLSEVCRFSDFEETRISSERPQRRSFGYVYRFHVQGRVSSEGLAQFLYEFYWASFLQRLTRIDLRPVENSEQMQISLNFEAITLFPPTRDSATPLFDQLPQGYHRRLSSGPFSTYESVAEQNLLQYARSGVDRADHTYLTLVLYENEIPKIWLTDRTSPSSDPIVVELDSPIKIGSFSAKLVEIDGESVVFEKNGQFWLLTVGDSLNQAFALPPEAR